MAINDPFAPDPFVFDPFTELIDPFTFNLSGDSTFLDMQAFPESFQFLPEGFDWGAFTFPDFDFEPFSPLALPIFDPSAFGGEPGGEGFLLSQSLDPIVQEQLTGLGLASSGEGPLSVFDVGRPAGFLEPDLADVPFTGLGADFVLPSATNVGSPGEFEGLGLSAFLGSPAASVDQGGPSLWDRFWGTASPSPAAKAAQAILDDPTSTPQQRIQAAQILAVTERTGPSGLDQLLKVGQFGTSLAGVGLSAFGRQKPKLSQEEKDELAARADLARAQAEAARERGTLEASLQAEQLATQERIAKLGRRQPLFSADPRFSALFNEVTGSARQPVITPEVLTLSRELAQPLIEQINADFTTQKAQIMEEANKLGVNPAGRLAQLEASRQQQIAVVLAQVQQQAVSLSQNRQTALVELLTRILGTTV